MWGDDELRWCGGSGIFFCGVRQSFTWTTKWLESRKRSSSCHIIRQSKIHLLSLNLKKMASIANHHAGARRPSDKNTARKKTKPVNKEIRRRVQQVFVQNLVLLGYEDFDIHGGKSRGKKKLDVSMFVRPNPTDFYRIVYFLLFKLRKNYIKEIKTII